MKYLGIDCGRLIEGFEILPSLGITWMTLKLNTYYDLRFSWFFWYVTFGQIKKKLKENGY